MATEAAEVFVWPRGTYLMEHFLWVGGGVPGDIGAAEELIRILEPSGSKDLIDRSTWSEACEEVGISESTSNSIFDNVSSNRETAEIQTLVVDVFLLHLPPILGSYSNRDDGICAFFHENIERFLRLKVCNSSGKLDDKNLESLDLLFDAMFDDRPTTVSRLVKTLWNGSRKDLHRLAKRIASCLVPDPFRICELPTEESVGRGLRKKTSLAPQGKRVVTVTGWYRIQLLVKDVFRGAHLRISHSQKYPASVFAPSFSLSVIVNNVSNCPCIVLGPCAGTVHLRGIRQSRVTTSCRRLIIEDCHDVTIFASSKLPPITVFSTGITFGPLNVAYTDLWEEMETAGSKKQMHFLPITPDDQWTQLSVEQFYLQPVPFVYSTEDIEKLLKMVPSKYASAWRRTTKQFQGGEESGLRPADIAYLRAKIRE